MHTVNITETSLDISSYTDNIKTSYMVSVRAAVGFEVSEVETAEFSYDTDLGVQQSCAMDFPSLNVTTEPGRITFRFLYPLFLHKDLVEKEKFTYSTFTSHDDKTWEMSCLLTDDFCSGSVFTNESTGHCIILKVDGFYGSLQLTTDRTVCIKDGIQCHVYIILGTVTFLIILVVIVVVLLIWRRVIKEQVLHFTSVIPSSLSPNSGTGDSTLKPESPCLSPVVTTGQTPLLTLEDCGKGDTVLSESCDVILENGHFPIGVPAASEEELVEPESKYDYEQRGTLDATMLERSDYDSPHCPLEMSPGDMVDGYGLRS
ncbi:interferon gamma receptor 1-like isoform X3 [Denticeps clupeoides]|nr:interferon gamma receptor 1 isoform X3 [Denticeps clupeoides]